jgi:hypothetical protein
MLSLLPGTHYPGIWYTLFTDGKSSMRGAGTMVVSIIALVLVAIALGVLAWWLERKGWL